MSNYHPLFARMLLHNQQTQEAFIQIVEVLHETGFKDTRGKPFKNKKLFREAFEKFKTERGYQ